MTDLLTLVLVIVAAVLLLRLLRTFFTRLSLLFKLRALGKTPGIAVKILHPFAAFLPRVTKKPVARVAAGGKIFLIRFFHGKGSGTSVHFAAPEYAARFTRVFAAAPKHSSLRVRAPGGDRTVTVRSTFSVPIGAKVFFIPPIETNEETYTPVLIFSPTPGELTYVSEARNSIRAAFTGDVFYGQAVFSPDSFLRFADRETRAQKEHDARDDLWGY